MVLPRELKVIVFVGWRTTQLTKVSVKKKTNYFVLIVLKTKVVNSCFRELIQIQIRHFILCHMLREFL